MSNLFFTNSEGKWDSRRIYFIKDVVKYISTILNIEVDTTPSSDHLLSVKFKWHSINTLTEKKESDGEITSLLSFNRDKLFRDAGYYTKDSTVSHIEELSEFYLKTRTEYNNTRFLEEVEFLSNDLRRRTMRAYKEGSIIMAGNYLERRCID